MHSVGKRSLVVTVGTLFATGPQQVNLFNADPSLAIWDLRHLTKDALRLQVNQLEVNVTSFSSCGKGLLECVAGTRIIRAHSCGGTSIILAAF